MAGQEPLRQFRDVKDAVYRYDAVFAAIKSPTEIYEDKLRSIQDRIAQIWSELPSAPPDQMSRLQENLIELGGQKKELEIDQKNNIGHYERVHAHKIRQTMDSFRDHLFQLMGPSSGQSQFQMTPDTTRLGTDRVESAPVEPEFSEPAPIVSVSADDEKDDGPMFDDSLMDDTIDDTMEDGADREPAQDILPQEDSVMQEPVETETHNEEPIEESPTENLTADEPFEAVPTNGEPAEDETAGDETAEQPAEEEAMATVPADREAGADSTVKLDGDQAAEVEAEAVEREPVDDKPIASRTRKPRNRIKASSRDIAAREDISARHARYTFSPSPSPAAETITVQADESDDEEDDEEEVEGEDEKEDENEDEDEDESSEEDEVSEAEFSEPEEAPPSPRQTRSGGVR
jgi:hypothetical protein